MSNRVWIVYTMFSIVSGTAGTMLDAAYFVCRITASCNRIMYIEKRRTISSSSMFTISLFWAVAIVCRRRSLDEKIIIYLCFFCFSFLFLRIVFSTSWQKCNQSFDFENCELKKKKIRNSFIHACCSFGELSKNIIILRFLFDRANTFPIGNYFCLLSAKIVNNSKFISIYLSS